MSERTYSDEELDAYDKLSASLVHFIQVMWGLSPQPVKKEYKSRWTIGLLVRGDAWQEFVDSVNADWFESFVEGEHITWQQTLAVYGVEKAMRGEAKRRISIVSGHGTGKSAILSMIILWFLFRVFQAQVACTAPTSTQMHDILWKELKKQIDRMPDGVKNLYEWQNDYIRMRGENRETWFARAKTSSKENSEALAGVHGPAVLMAVDEASGVEEEIFNTMEGALTEKETLVFLISNGTRNDGYFHATHHSDKERWQRFRFDSEASPRVDTEYVEGIIAKHGRDSVEFRIRVSGQFPDEGSMDDAGYTPLYGPNDLHFVSGEDWKPVGRCILGVDPSGEGQNKTIWVLRDRSKAKIIHREETSNPLSVATKTVSLAEQYRVDPGDIVIDNFGVGGNVAQEIAIITATTENFPWRVYAINVGEPCDDEDDKLLYINKRAEMYIKSRNWLRAGGELIKEGDIAKNAWEKELQSIRMKRNTAGRIQIMDKVTMKKKGFESPDRADAFALTFLRSAKAKTRAAQKSDFNKHDIGDA